MTTLDELATQVRSKNAGPFWMTIDVFFNDYDAYECASRSALTDPAAVGRLYATDAERVRVYRLPLLMAIKVSLPRPVVQGSVGDRDMHAGQQFVPLLDLPNARPRPVMTTRRLRLIEAPRASRDRKSEVSKRFSEKGRLCSTGDGHTTRQTRTRWVDSVR